MEEEEGAYPGRVWVCVEVLDVPLPCKGCGAAVLPGKNTTGWGGKKISLKSLQSHR